jgi:hypothetical protein
MLPQESIDHFVTAVQNMRTAQQRFFTMRTSTHLNTAKKWELLVDKELIKIKKELFLQETPEPTQGKLL